ncbi:phenazine biosynthesis-like domain-containing protein isoform X2 [Notamacropus eugenii]|uniref:phenazine biosynthesis-like domain-containing protein isoform X2 n=1 Tax=Notamacropus eugenii TaxID=9315 RepID=UPI003B67BAE4
MRLPVFVVDAFTGEAFRGNPAAVCLLENELDDKVRQKIAREMNHSETAFIQKLHPTDSFTQSSRFGLRWFTPAAEVPFCGHATLASSAVLFYKIKNVNPTLTFLTLTGEFKARRAEDGIIMDLPLCPTLPQDVKEVQDLIKSAVGNVVIQDVRYCPDTKYLFVRIDDSYGRAFLENLEVNTRNMTEIENTGKVMGFMLTVKGEGSRKIQGYDFYSRFFGPWLGVAEDPVTGQNPPVWGSDYSVRLITAIPSRPRLLSDGLT